MSERTTGADEPELAPKPGDGEAGTGRSVDPLDTAGTSGDDTENTSTAEISGTVENASTAARSGTDESSGTAAQFSTARASDTEATGTTEASGATRVSGTDEAPSGTEAPGTTALPGIGTPGTTEVSGTPGTTGQPGTGTSQGPGSGSVGDRYGGTSRRTPRWMLPVLSVGVVVLGLIIAYIGYRQFGPKDIDPQQLGYSIINDSTIEAHFKVTRTHPERPAVCFVRAMDSNGSEVGRREVLIAPSNSGTVELKTIVRSVARPAATDIYGCGSVVPAYLRAG